MTLVLTTNALGEIRGTPVALPNRRRRLSTVVARHRPPGRQNFIVSVHKRGDENERYFANDKTVRLKAQWSKTLLGPKDVVVITKVPRGKSFLAIGLAIASIALIAIAPYAAPIIAGAAVFGAGAGAAAGGLTIAIQAGLVIGGVALGYAAQMAKSAGQNKKKLESYSLSGGGNVPKPNSRKPLLYGRCWSSPPLSQQDFIRIETEGQQTSQVIVKRMTVGLGKFQFHKVKVGDALFWDETTGIQAPFNKATGDQGAAIEFLYEQPSNIMPGDVFTSSQVAGQEVPRRGSNPDRTPWYRLTPQGVVADAAQMNWTYPAIYRVSSDKEKPTSVNITFYGRKIDPNTGEVIGPEIVLWESTENNAFIRTPLRRNAYFRLPEPDSTYEVSAQNIFAEPPPDDKGQNAVFWDAMYAFKDDTRTRPQTSEIVFRMKAVKGVTVTAYSDITVLATRIIPVWNGTSWVEQPTRKAVWAYCDLVRSGYGLALPNGVESSKALYYANLLNDDDTFDGQLPEVSSFWEAAGEVLLPFRCDPIKVGQVHTFVRDEARDEPRHVITRRQIVKDSSSATYKTKVEGSDVIVEFNRDGDPKRPDEVRYSYGPRSRTPKRYKINGITDGTHAMKHATWLAAIAVFRGNERKLTMEWDGRLVFPGDHALVDVWFLDTKNVWGVAKASGRMLTLDTDANISTDWTYGSVRTRVGREWGILRMRGVGVRGLELHPTDVTALQIKTGLPLSQVLNTDKQGPTTIAMGDLIELQETFVARSGVPADPDNVQLELVKDDIRVWQLLDETPIVPAPIDSSSLEEPLIPVISVLHARCNNIETGIEISFGVSETLGARNYEFDLSYDANNSSGGTWEVLSAFGPASTGRAMMRQQVDTPVTVRARAFGRTGLPGEYIYTTVTTVAPVVDGTYLSPLSVQFSALSEYIKAQLDAVSDLGSGVLAEGHDQTQVALDLGKDTIRGSLRQIEQLLNRMSEASATEIGNAYEARQLIKVGNDKNFAFIERVDEARVSDKESFVGITESLGNRLTSAEGDIVANGTAIFGLSSALDITDGKVESVQQAVTTLGGSLDLLDLDIKAEATARSLLETRVTEVDGAVKVVSQDLVTLDSTIKDRITGEVEARALAVDQVRTEVTKVDGRVTSEAERTTALESTTKNLEGDIGNTATALQKLTTRTETIEGNEISTSAFLIDLEGKLKDTNEDIGATSQAVVKVSQEVERVDGVVKSSAEAITALDGKVGSVKEDGEATARSVDSLSQTVSQVGTDLSTTSQAVTRLEGRIKTTEEDIDASALVVESLYQSVERIDGKVTSTAESISQVKTTADGAAASVTTLAGSYDGIRVQYSVVLEQDGQTGGFILAGVKQLDGSPTVFEMKLRGNLLVAGSITAENLTLTGSLITVDGQIGDLVVSTRAIGIRQVSNYAAGVGSGKSVDVMMNVRPNSFIFLIGYAVNGPQTEFSTTVQPGQIQIQIDDTSIINSIPNNFVSTGTGDSRRSRILSSSIMGFSAPQQGMRKFTFINTSSADVPGVVLFVMEFAR